MTFPSTLKSTKTTLLGISIKNGKSTDSQINYLKKPCLCPHPEFPATNITIQTIVNIL